MNSLKAARDIVQGLGAMKTEAAVNEAKISLQGLILDAQQSLFAAQGAMSSAAAYKIVDHSYVVVVSAGASSTTLRELRAFA